LVCPPANPRHAPVLSLRAYFLTNCHVLIHTFVSQIPPPTILLSVTLTGSSALAHVWAPLFWLLRELLPRTTRTFLLRLVRIYSVVVQLLFLTPFPHNGFVDVFSLTLLASLISSPRRVTLNWSLDPFLHIFFLVTPLPPIYQISIPA